MVQVIESTAMFNQIVSSNSVVIVDFHASWCGPCKMISPKFEGFEKVYTTIKFVKVDVDEITEVAEKAEIKAMPTFQIYKDGVMVEEVVGADPIKLEGAIKKYQV